MTTREHLLAVAAEECMEIALEAALLAQRFSKALRFGVEETQPGQPDDNWTRILSTYEKLQREGDDLHAVMAMLDMVMIYRSPRDVDALREKQEKVKRFLAYSEQCGTLSDVVIREMRAVVIAAGQASVEGVQDARSIADGIVAERCSLWADRLEGKQA